MSYFNPKIYNKQNLKKSDLNMLEYWESRFLLLISSAEDNFSMYATGSETIDNIRAEIVESFCNDLKQQLGFALQEEVVGIIDNYDEEIEEVEDYETFIHTEDKENE